MENEQNEKDLKIQALVEQLGTQASNYESKVADLRVHNTMLSQELTQANGEMETLRQEVFRLQGELASFTNDVVEDAVVEGELVNG